MKHPPVLTLHGHPGQLLALLALLVLTSGKSNCQTTGDPDSLQIIDAHTHTEFTGKTEESSGIPMTREEYFREWREAGVVGAVAHAHEDESWDRAPCWYCRSRRGKRTWPALGREVESG